MRFSTALLALWALVNLVLAGPPTSILYVDELTGYTNEIVTFADVTTDFLSVEHQTVSTPIVLNSATPIVIDTPGGIKFSAESFQLNSGGTLDLVANGNNAIISGTQVSLTSSDDFVVTTTGSFELFSSQISLESNDGIQFNGASTSVQTRDSLGFSGGSSTVSADDAVVYQGSSVEFTGGDFVIESLSGNIKSLSESHIVDADSIQFETTNGLIIESFVNEILLNAQTASYTGYNVISRAISRLTISSGSFSAVANSGNIDLQGSLIVGTTDGDTTFNAGNDILSSTTGSYRFSSASILFDAANVNFLSNFLVEIEANNNVEFTSSTVEFSGDNLYIRSTSNSQYSSSASILIDSQYVSISGNNYQSTNSIYFLSTLTISLLANSASFQAQDQINIAGTGISFVGATGLFDSSANTQLTTSAVTYTAPTVTFAGSKQVTFSANLVDVDTTGAIVGNSMDDIIFSGTSTTLSQLTSKVIGRESVFYSSATTRFNSASVTVSSADLFWISAGSTLSIQATQINLTPSNNLELNTAAWTQLSGTTQTYPGTYIELFGTGDISINSPNNQAVEISAGRNIAVTTGAFTQTIGNVLTYSSGSTITFRSLPENGQISVTGQTTIQTDTFLVSSSLVAQTGPLSITGSTVELLSDANAGQITLNFNSITWGATSAFNLNSQAVQGVSFVASGAFTVSNPTTLTQTSQSDLFVGSATVFTINGQTTSFTSNNVTVEATTDFDATGVNNLVSISSGRAIEFNGNTGITSTPTTLQLSSTQQVQIASTNTVSLTAGKTATTTTISSGDLLTFATNADLTLNTNSLTVTSGGDLNLFGLNTFTLTSANDVTFTQSSSTLQIGDALSFSSGQTITFPNSPSFTLQSDRGSLSIRSANTQTWDVSQGIQWTTNSFSSTGLTLSIESSGNMEFSTTGSLFNTNDGSFPPSNNDVSFVADSWDVSASAFFVVANGINQTNNAGMEFNGASSVSVSSTDLVIDTWTGLELVGGALGLTWTTGDSGSINSEQGGISFVSYGRSQVNNQGLTIDVNGFAEIQLSTLSNVLVQASEQIVFDIDDDMYIDSGSTNFSTYSTGTNEFMVFRADSVSTLSKNLNIQGQSVSFASSGSVSITSGDSISFHAYGFGSNTPGIAVTSTGVIDLTATGATNQIQSYASGSQSFFANKGQFKSTSGGNTLLNSQGGLFSIVAGNAPVSFTSNTGALNLIAGGVQGEVSIQSGATTLTASNGAISQLANNRIFYSASGNVPITATNSILLQTTSNTEPILFESGGSISLATSSAVSNGISITGQVVEFLSSTSSTTVNGNQIVIGDVQALNNPRFIVYGGAVSLTSTPGILQLISNQDFISESQTTLFGNIPASISFTTNGQLNVATTGANGPTASSLTLDTSSASSVAGPLSISGLVQTSIKGTGKTSIFGSNKFTLTSTGTQPASGIHIDSRNDVRFSAAGVLTVAPSRSFGIDSQTTSVTTQSLAITTTDSMNFDADNSLTFISNKDMSVSTKAKNGRITFTTEAADSDLTLLSTGQISLSSAGSINLRSQTVGMSTQGTFSISTSNPATGTISVRASDSISFLSTGNSIYKTADSMTITASGPNAPLIASSGTTTSFSGSSITLQNTPGNHGDISIYTATNGLLRSTLQTSISSANNVNFIVTSPTGTGLVSVQTDATIGVDGYFEITSGNTFTITTPIINIGTDDGRVLVSSQTTSITGNTINLTGFDGINAQLTDTTLANIASQSISFTSTGQVSVSADLANLSVSGMQAVAASAGSVTIQAAGSRQPGVGQPTYGVLFQSNAVGADILFQSATTGASISATNLVSFAATGKDDSTGTIAINSAGTISLITASATNSLMLLESTGRVGLGATTISATTSGVFGYSAGPIEVRAEANSPAFVIPSLSVSNKYGTMSFKTVGQTNRPGNILIQSTSSAVNILSTNGDISLVNTDGGIHVGATQTISLVSTSIFSNLYTVDSMRFTAMDSIGMRAVAGNVNFTNTAVTFEMLQDNHLSVDSAGSITVDTPVVNVQSLTYPLYVNSTRGSVRLTSPLISFEMTNLLMQGQNINVQAQTAFISGENQGAYFVGDLTTVSAPGSQGALNRGVGFLSLLLYSPAPAVQDAPCRLERALGVTASSTDTFCLCQNGYWRCIDGTP